MNPIIRVKPACLALIGTLMMSFSSSKFAESPHPFLAKDFEVPAILETDRFRLRMLTVSDVVKDFDAVMTERFSDK
jgi:hypothetical protein